MRILEIRAPLAKVRSYFASPAVSESLLSSILSQRTVVMNLDRRQLLQGAAWASVGLGVHGLDIEQAMAEEGMSGEASQWPEY